MGGWFAEFLASQGFRVAIADPKGGLAARFRYRVDDWQTDASGFRPHRAGDSLARRHCRIACRCWPGARRADWIFDLGSLKTPLRSGLGCVGQGGLPGYLRASHVRARYGTALGPARDFHRSGQQSRRAQPGAGTVRPHHGGARGHGLGRARSVDRLRVLGLVARPEYRLFYGAGRQRRSWAPRLAKLSSTTFDSQLEVASRVAAESPDLYFEIQSSNDYGNESLLALQKAVERLVTTVRTNNAQEFTALMTRGRAYFDERAAARAG